MSTRRDWLWLVQNQFEFSDCQEGATRGAAGTVRLWDTAEVYQWTQNSFEDEPYFVPSLIALPGTDWLNRHDDSAFDDYRTLLFTAGTYGRGKGRQAEGVILFSQDMRWHVQYATHTCNKCSRLDKILSDVYLEVSRWEKRGLAAYCVSMHEEYCTKGNETFLI